MYAYTSRYHVIIFKYLHTHKIMYISARIFILVTIDSLNWPDNILLRYSKLIMQKKSFPLLSVRHRSHDWAARPSTEICINCQPSRRKYLHMNHGQTCHIRQYWVMRCGHPPLYKFIGNVGTYILRMWWEGAPCKSCTGLLQWKTFIWNPKDMLETVATGPVPVTGFWSTATLALNNSPCGHSKTICWHGFSMLGQWIGPPVRDRYPAYYHSDHSNQHMSPVAGTQHYPCHDQLLGSEILRATWIRNFRGQYQVMKTLVETPIIRCCLTWIWIIRLWHIPSIVLP